MVQLNEMFHDLSYLVQEQQVGIDLIENNITKTKEEAKSGQAELISAQEYQKSSRKWMCWLLLILAIVAGVVCLIVFTKKDK